MSDSDKGEDMVAVSLDFLYNEFDDSGAAHKLYGQMGLWMDSSSAFKNKFMVKFLQPSVRSTKAFLMEMFTINHVTKLMELVAKLSLWLR